MKIDKIFLLLVAMVLLFNFSVPLKNFPLNDDYVYFNSVENFLKGELRLHPNASMTFLLQGFYGVLISFIFGFSHQSLIIGTIILSSIAVFALYFLLKKFVGKGWALLGSLALLINPVYFYLTHTFMTDVPMLSLMIVSIFFIYKGVEEKKDKYIAIGVIFSLAAFWIRQFGIAPIIGLFLYYLIHKRNELLKLKNLFLIIIIPILFMGVWFYWYNYIHGPSDCIRDFYVLGPNVLRNFGKTLLTMGYFLFPLAFLFLINIRKLASVFKNLELIPKLFVIAAIFFMLGWIFYINLFQNETVFYKYFLASDLGTGTTFNVLFGMKDNLFPEYFWIPITFLSIVAATGILLATLKSKDNEKYRILIYFLIAYSLLFLFVRGFFERYFLPLFVLFLPFVISFIRNLKFSKVLFIFFIIIFGLWSWYSVYENLSWNQARWDVINELIASGVTENKIDGGTEYNMRFFKSCANPTGAVKFYGWAYSLSDEYVISFDKLNNYEIEIMKEYNDPFGRKLGTIYALKKSR